jgi:hypothetical protein
MNRFVHERNAHVRFDRDVASPLRPFFDYTLTDSKAKVLAGGSKGLVVGDYLSRYAYYPNIEQTQTLFYEKVTLNRWLDYRHNRTCSSQI